MSINGHVSFASYPIISTLSIPTDAPTVSPTVAPSAKNDNSKDSSNRLLPLIALTCIIPIWLVMCIFCEGMFGCGSFVNFFNELERRSYHRKMNRPQQRDGEHGDYAPQTTEDDNEKPEFEEDIVTLEPENDDAIVVDASDTEGIRLDENGVADDIENRKSDIQEDMTSGVDNNDVMNNGFY